MIISFADKMTEDIYHGRASKAALKFPVLLHRIAQRKLSILNRAKIIQDIKVPPSNHLEVLKGDLKGKYSIRINKQWRIVFNWTEVGIENVTIMDYH